MVYYYIIIIWLLPLKMWSLGRENEITHFIYNNLYMLMVMNLTFYKKKRKSRTNLHIYMHVDVIN